MKTETEKGAAVSQDLCQVAGSKCLQRARSSMEGTQNNIRKSPLLLLVQPSEKEQKIRQSKIYISSQVQCCPVRFDPSTALSLVSVLCPSNKGTFADGFQCFFF